MKKVVIGFVGCLMLLGVYAAQNGGKKPHEGGKAGEASHTSRNAFVEVTAPAGLRVK